MLPHDLRIQLKFKQTLEYFICFNLLSVLFYLFKTSSGCTVKYTSRMYANNIYLINSVQSDEQKIKLYGFNVTTISAYQSILFVKTTIVANLQRAFSLGKTDESGFVSSADPSYFKTTECSNFVMKQQIEFYILINHPHNTIRNEYLISYMAIYILIEQSL